MIIYNLLPKLILKTNLLVHEYKANIKRQNYNGCVYAEVYNITHVLIENEKGEQSKRL